MVYIYIRIAMISIHRYFFFNSTEWSSEKPKVFEMSGASQTPFSLFHAMVYIYIRIAMISKAYTLSPIHVLLFYFHENSLCKRTFIIDKNFENGKKGYEHRETCLQKASLRIKFFTKFPFFSGMKKRKYISIYWITWDDVTVFWE